MCDCVEVQGQLHGKASAVRRYAVCRLRIENIRQHMLQQLAAVPCMFPFNGRCGERGSSKAPYFEALVVSS
jgi:hypothetical protein